MRSASRRRILHTIKGNLFWAFALQRGRDPARDDRTSRSDHRRGGHGCVEPVRRLELAATPPLPLDEGGDYDPRLHRGQGRARQAPASHRGAGARHRAHGRRRPLLHRHPHADLSGDDSAREPRLSRSSTTTSTTASRERSPQATPSRLGERARSSSMPSIGSREPASSVPRADRSVAWDGCGIGGGDRCCPRFSLRRSCSSPPGSRSPSTSGLRPRVLDRALVGPVPGAVILVFAVADYVLWRARGRPWHDWQVILLLLPADRSRGLDRNRRARPRRRVLARLSCSVSRSGPDIALVGLLDDDDLLPRPPPPGRVPVGHVPWRHSRCQAPGVLRSAMSRCLAPGHGPLARAGRELSA